MRICHVTSAHPADDPRIVFKEALYAANEGHEVILIARLSENDPPPGIRFVPLPCTVPRLKRLLWLSRRAATLAAAKHADVYHLHDPELLPWIGLLKRTGARVVYDMHEDLPAQIMTKHWLPSFLRLPLARLSAWYLSHRLRSCDAIVHANPTTFRDRVDVGRPQVLVKNSPVPSTLVAAPMGPSEPVRLVYVGALTGIRGLDVMLDAVVQVQASRSARLVLAGSFSPLSLEDSARLHPGWRHTEFLGRLPHSAIPELLASAHVGLCLFAPAPHHIESQPTKLFEYLISGLPWIGSDFPGWSQLAAESGSGITVDPTSASAVANAVLTLTADTNTWARFSRAGAEAARPFTWEAEYRTLADLYRSLLGSP